jgi:preprotein translocase subunit SecY
VFESLLNAFRAPDIRRRILFVLGALIVFRFLAHVPVPGVNKDALAQFFGGNPLFGLIDLFSGGGLSNFSVVGLGVNPYINASIIMQLMTGVIPSLQALSREGEYGRNKINQYTRYLSVPMATLQAYGFLALLNANQVLTGTFSLSSFTTLTQIATLTAGSIALMWIGELITERGIGNGVSFIIFAGIVSRAPSAIQGLTTTSLTAIILFVLIGIAAVGVIIYIQEGQRRIPVQYASRVRGRRMYQGGQTFLPLRVNQAGVIPIIFAISIMFFPVIIGNFLATAPSPWGDISRVLRTYWVPAGPNIPTDILYNFVYFILIFGFTYFYTAVTFDPVDTADYLKKHAAFIPGIRPGVATAQYLDRTMTRITFAGALFLGGVTVLIPLLATALTRIPTQNMYLGGTAILIVVGVALDTMKQIETQLIMRQYKGFIK